jgi:SNF2 family DNA or RNA helicase
MGKTAIIMAEFSNLAASNKVNLLLVICPNTLRANWAAEAEKFGFAYEVAVYPDPPPRFGMWVVNYERLVTKTYSEIFKAVRSNNTMIVCDESHRIKNPKAKSTKAAIALYDQARYKRVMTGTPMANNVIDLWPQLRAIGHNGSHRTPFTWRNRYGVMGGWMGKVVVGVQREEELKAIIDGCAFQAKKADWLKTLPPKAYYTLQYDMLKAQKDAYKKIYTDRFLEVDNSEITASIVITALMKMQQITSGFMMDDEGKVVYLVEPYANPKINAVKEAVSEIEGKIILFAHYRETIRLLQNSGIGKYVTIIGGMNKDDISKAVNDFNNDDSVRFLIAQTATAKEGITLLGNANIPCYTTVFVENTYSLIDRTQAEDRNHRHGQVAEQVSYYDLVGSKLEAKIIKALQGKKDLVKSVMEGV